MQKTNYKNRWAAIRRSLTKQSITPGVFKRGCVMTNGDARKVLKALPSLSVDCIVTSPPYGALKNYGSKAQLGYGQHINKQYLPDIESILAELFRVARVGASLWLVLDSIKSNGEALMLPWEMARLAQIHGWKLHDVVVWDKGRSLPWSHRGQFRGVCEFIVLLSKGTLRTYNLDAARDLDDLSGYWVKYPERFNPKGKAPTDLWHFPIPVQGSWSKTSLRHFCPFPPSLVGRILTISTKEHDIVLDPFSGTGSVIVTATALGRLGCGIEVNRSFVKGFGATGYSSLYQQIKSGVGGAINKSLSKTILRLRVLKYPKSLFVQLSRNDRLGIEALNSIAAFVIRKISLSQSTGREDKNVLATAAVDVLLFNEGQKARVKQAIEECMNIPPLSKFGLEMTVRVIASDTWMRGRYFRSLNRSSWFTYLNGNFHEFYQNLLKTDLRCELTKVGSGRTRKYPVIIAPIGEKIDSYH